MRARNVLTMWSTLSVLSLSATAWAQVPYDPPTAVRPPPNVMVLMDATRTTMINGQTCRGLCHQEGNCGVGQEHDCGIYARGETRIQLARRVLTGGWGWNTSHVDATNGVADARVRTDGVMDNYRVRWGVAWYDGLGTRIVVDPTLDSAAAQQAVIDFGLASNETLGQGVDNGAGTVSLNSWLPYYRTTNCCSNASVAAADGAAARMARALETIRQYWQPGVNAVRFPATTFSRNAGAQNGNSVTWEQGPIDPGDETVIDLDPSNVLVTAPGAGGCRRNFTIMLTDGHGGGDWDPDGAGPLPAISRAVAAAGIANMTGPGGVNLRTTIATRDFSNQLFVIHFGTQDKPNADTVADFGFDGIAGGTGLMTAFEGAPGGQITDLTPMLAAFSAVMGLVLDGTFTGAAPSVTRFGDYLVSSEFEIQSCAGLSPIQCNIGRPGTVRWRPIDQTGCDQTPKGPNCGRLLNQTWDAGSILEQRDHRTRRIFTGAPFAIDANNQAVSDTNCGPFGTCGTRNAGATSVPDLTWGFHHATCTHEVPPSAFNSAAVTNWGALGLRWRDIAFLRGDPISKFANGVFRGDWACNPLVAGTCCIDTNNDFVPDGASAGTARAATCLDRQYKLADIANSKPVLVGAPAGIGEDITRWRHFLDVEIGRSGNAIVPTPANAAANNGSGNPVRVGNRDEVIYLGGNDGMLHAFLSRRERPRTAANPGDPGRTIDYQPIGSACNTGDRWCDGLELWAYAPRQLIPSWPLLQSGHFHMVDGTPVVADVLFTRGLATPRDPSAGLCHSISGACNDWEYRTVLMQCLGAGGRGCFALDVTDPYAPQILWERTFDRAATQQGALRGTSTSKPQIVKVKRVVTNANGIPVSIPYYVAVMGGGMNEVNATTGNRQGTFIVVGLEDGRYWLSTAAQAASADFSGSPTCLDTDNDTFADTCYIATTDASMYKIRFTDGDPSQGITMRRFFDGRQAVSSVYGLSGLDLRTYHRVVATFDVSGSLNLFYGTGNFEAISDPAEQNFFFKVVDNDPTAAPAVPANAGANLARTSGACDVRLTGGGPNPTVANTGVLSLAAGEKIVFDPVIAAGSVFFTSYRPNANICLAGDGYLYGLNYANCRAGIDTNAATSGADTQRIALTGPSNQGLPTAPIVNELSDTVYAQLSNGTIEDAAASTPPSVQVPLIKLWWREVTQ